MNNKLGSNLRSMFQFWILEDIKVNKGEKPDWKLISDIRGALCHGLRFYITPDSITLQVNVLYKVNKNGYRGQTHTLFEIIDYKETNDTLWFKDTVGEYLFRKTDHTMESYIQETSNNDLKQFQA